MIDKNMLPLPLSITKIQSRIVEEIRTKLHAAVTILHVATTDSRGKGIAHSTSD
jgi:hypothetical protein